MRTVALTQTHVTHFLGVHLALPSPDMQHYVESRQDYAPPLHMNAGWGEGKGKA